VALNAAEEETLEAVKVWWQDNGRQLLIVVALVVGGYAGWTLWQNSQQTTATAASELFEQVLELTLETGAQDAVSEDEGRQVIALAESLRQEFPGSDYARFATLFAAQQQVRLEDLPAAEEALRWILNNPRSGLLSSEDEGLRLTASLRLGRVLLAQGEADSALQLINSLEPGPFEAGFSELRGDIYVALDRPLDARDAYVAAQQAGSTSQNLQLKLNSLAADS